MMIWEIIIIKVLMKWEDMENNNKNIVMIKLIIESIHICQIMIQELKKRKLILIGQQEMMFYYYNQLKNQEKIIGNKLQIKLKLKILQIVKEDML